MPEIKCPNCGKIFQMDEANYDSIVKQVRDSEFNNELERREKEFNLQINSAVELAKSESARIANDELKNKDIKIKELEAQLNSKDEIANSKINEAINASKQEIYDLQIKVSNLNNELAIKDSETKNKISEVISNKDKEILQLKSKLEISDKESKLNEQNIRNKYEADIDALNQEIEFYKDFKAKQSTKMIGESLEQHCAYEFNRIRSTAFKNAYFGKDNEVSNASNSKGDFIFREYDDEKTEIVSIMFEMKNETDSTSTKQKNEHFFKELDKDRNEKGCEYAILVSMLEPESDLYNEGIVDVSYMYPKMYVIRPQFFIPIITLIRNASLNSLNYKKELKLIQNQNLDYAKFEENMKQFKDAFGKNFELAANDFRKAIDDIDKTIKALEKTKEDLLKSGRQLRLANDKAQELSIKKLTHNAPSLEEKFINK